MKDVVWWLVVCIVLLGLFGVAGCGEDRAQGGETSSSPSENSGQSSSPASESSADSAGEGIGTGFWSDMPVYVASTQVQKGTWSIPPQDDSEYTKVEWRYYELPGGNAPDMVARFYQMEMPKHGWQEMMNLDAQGTTMTFFTKNSENDAAYVWATEDSGKVVYALMRAKR